MNEFRMRSGPMEMTSYHGQCAQVTLHCTEREADAKATYWSASCPGDDWQHGDYISFDIDLPNPDYATGDGEPLYLAKIACFLSVDQAVALRNQLDKAIAGHSEESIEASVKEVAV